MSSTTPHSTLLILDVDETLIYASETHLDRNPAFRVGPYFIFLRPGLAEFLRHCQQDFEVALWSFSGEDYLAAVVEQIFPTRYLKFVWSRTRCVQRFSEERSESYSVKDLKKVERLRFDLKRVLVVDDTPQKVERNYGNAIYVRPYYGDPADDELRRLGRYLTTIVGISDVRAIEKREWRFRVSIDT